MQNERGYKFPTIALSDMGSLTVRVGAWVQEVPGRRAVLTITEGNLRTQIWGPGADTDEPWRILLKETGSATEATPPHNNLNGTEEM
jgi:hypothetical protein